MQIAAAKPQCIGREDVDQEALAHEREVLRKQALEEGKPEKIVEKMVDGRINKYYKEVCLVEQEFVKDSDKTIKDILAGVEVRRFARFGLCSRSCSSDEIKTEKFSKSRGHAVVLCFLKAYNKVG